MTKDLLNIEILTVNHKASYIPENALLKPIQVGAALASKRLEDMVYYDDEGDNISDKNASYCELTATYWAWKNVTADYYGLFHYRRYLNFAPESKTTHYAGRAYSTIPAAIEDIQLNESRMREVIEKYDLVVPRKDNTQAATGDASLYEQYASEHYAKDLDFCIEYIKSNHTNIAPYLDVLQGNEAYFCNMFVMKKELFNEYCEFIFDVLDSFEANTDLSGYNTQQYRVTGFLAERLTNVFIQYLIASNKYRVKELQMVYFENTEPIETIEPISKDAVSVVLAADDYYVPYVSTLLGSLAATSNTIDTYDITVFHKNITPQNQALLQLSIEGKDNIHLRFCNMSGRLDEFEGLATKWHITVETYFRLFIPEIMAKYEKVLYLDGDMIIKRDVAELFRESVDGYLLAACRDVDMAGVYTSNLVEAENTINKDMKEHIDTVVGLKDPYAYFQAGVLLLNLSEMRKFHTTKEYLDIATKQKWEYLDQDILNHVARGKVKYLDLKWNVLYDWEYVRIKDVISKAPVWVFKEYMASRKTPYIIHYGGSIKPWQRADADMANEYWSIARQSVFYELILSRMAVWAGEHKKVGVQPQKLRLRTRVVRKLRRGADIVAPKGTAIRKPITAASVFAKRFIR